MWLAATQIYWNKREFLQKEKLGLTPTGVVWNTNMAAVSLFWDNIMADMVTSYENALEFAITRSILLCNNHEVSALFQFQPLAF